MLGGDKCNEKDKKLKQWGWGMMRWRCWRREVGRGEPWMGASEQRPRGIEGASCVFPTGRRTVAEDEIGKRLACCQEHKVMSSWS